MQNGGAMSEIFSDTEHIIKSKPMQDAQQQDIISYQLNNRTQIYENLDEIDENADFLVKRGSYPNNKISLNAKEKMTKSIELIPM